MTRARPDFHAQFGPRAFFDEANAAPTALGDPFAFSDLTRQMLRFGTSVMIATSIVSATSFMAGAALGYALGVIHGQRGDDV